MTTVCSKRVNKLWFHQSMFVPWKERRVLSRPNGAWDFGTTENIFLIWQNHCRRSFSFSFVAVPHKVSSLLVFWGQTAVVFSCTMATMEGRGNILPPKKHSVQILPIQDAPLLTQICSVDFPSVDLLWLRMAQNGKHSTQWERTNEHLSTKTDSSCNLGAFMFKLLQKLRNNSYLTFPQSLSSTRRSRTSTTSLPLWCLLAQIHFLVLSPHKTSKKHGISLKWNLAPAINCIPSGNNLKQPGFSAPFLVTSFKLIKTWCSFAFGVLLESTENEICCVASKEKALVRPYRTRRFHSGIVNTSHQEQFVFLNLANTAVCDCTTPMENTFLPPIYTVSLTVKNIVLKPQSKSWCGNWPEQASKTTRSPPRAVTCGNAGQAKADCLPARRDSSTSNPGNKIPQIQKENVKGTIVPVRSILWHPSIPRQHMPVILWQSAIYTSHLSRAVFQSARRRCFKFELSTVLETSLERLCVHRCEGPLNKLVLHRI